jgi:hypothetical protein
MKLAGFVTANAEGGQVSPIFSKLNLRSEPEILVVNAPPSFEAELRGLEGVKVVRTPQECVAIRFALVFVTARKEVDALAGVLAGRADADPVLWFAYPKQTSRRYKCDFNRDTGWQALGLAGFESVRMVAIDEDWSALRFRKAEFVQSRARHPSRAAPVGKRNAAR